MKNAGKPLAVVGGRVIAESGVIDDGMLATRDGLITYVGPRRDDIAAGVEVVDASGCCVSPGFIDLHVHGAEGSNFLDGDAEAVARICAAHARHGTTGMLATIGAAPMERIRNAISSLRAVIGSGEAKGLLGISLEGPYLNPQRCGAQPREHLLAPDRAELADLAELAGGTLKMVTLAPELDGAMECVRFLTDSGIVPAIGHSDATLDESREAFAAGVRYVTHLFNAMSGLHHRRPGLAAAALASPGVVVELIADGVHVHPLLLRMAFLLKGSAEIVLATDCTEALDSGDVELRSAGRAVSVRDGAPHLEGGVLYGTTLSMERAVANAKQFAGAGFAEAVMMATFNPARILGIESKKGSLAPGKDADLVLFGEEMDVRATIIGGQMVHRA